MTFDQFLRIVRARWLLVMAIFLSIVTVTLVASLIWPKSYTATASVMVDMRPDPVSAIASLSGATAMNFVATQVDIIGSKRVAQRVVRTMGLDQSPEMRARWMKETKGQGDMEAWIATILSKNLEIKPSRESNVIDIIYEGADSKFAAAMANTYAKAYIEATTQLKVDPARQYAEFFEERARIARDKVERAQARLAEAQKDKNIIATEERLDVETQRLSELSQQVLALKALRVESSNRDKQARSRPEQTAEVLNNMVVSTLKNQLASQEANLNQLSERLGDQHPQVIELKANIQSLRSKIAMETSRVTNSVGLNNAVTSSREAAASAAYEEQRAKLLRLKEERSQLAVLEREVESAQRVYDAIQMRLSQTNLESNNSQSGVVLLNAATEPSTPSSPRLVLNTALATVLGLLIALITVLGIELMDRRVRSSFDIMDTLELPVLGVLPGPNTPAHKRLPWQKKPAPGQSTSSVITSLKRANPA
ncbi:chain length determinant protein EpsF, partial [Aquabacterium sp.]|uniref:chain length determinant protein EpsF n=1 Tax=Aquabacterium sp. TaxID=1872578 RepID=UPI0025C3D081